MNRRYSHYVLVLLALVLSVCPAVGQYDHASFVADVNALTKTPHRLTGTAESAAAIDYVYQQLSAISPDGLWRLEMPAWQLNEPDGPGMLTIKGVQIPVAACRPNVLVTPSTPVDGLHGPVVYVGRGEVDDFARRSVQGALVVMELENANWQRAFARGAAAVLFLDRRDQSPRAMLPSLQATVPVNLVRGMVTCDANGTAMGVDLTADHEAASLSMNIGWQATTGSNVVAYIRGTDATRSGAADQREAIVLAASIDSFGIAPRRSPGARGAANAAWLIDLARRFVIERPQRDVLLLFVDGQAQSHAGARAIYDAWCMADDEHQQLVTSHRAEHDQVTAMMRLLNGSDSLQAVGSVDAVDAVNRTGVTESGATPLAWWRHEVLTERLTNHADWLRADIARQLQDMRLSKNYEHGLSGANVDATEALHTSQMRWDRLRSALHGGEFVDFVESLNTQAESGDAAAQAIRDGQLQQLKSVTLEWLRNRRDELDIEIRIDAQRAAMRVGLDAGSDSTATNRVQPILHITLDISDAVDRYGVVVGDYTYEIASNRALGSQADGAHFYSQILKALTNATRELDLPSLEQATLRDPNNGKNFAQGLFVNSGAIAGLHGFYNVAIMTGHDARPREGSSHDTLDALDLDVFRRQMDQVSLWLARIVDEPAVAQPRRFAEQTLTRRVVWSSGMVDGPLANLRVVGGLSENRPATGAVVAFWAGIDSVGQAPQSWEALALNAVPFYEPLRLSRVQSNGRFAIGPLQRTQFQWTDVFAMIPDDRGQPVAATTANTLVHQTNAAIRVDLVRLNASTIVVPWEPYASLNPARFMVLNATSNTRPRTNQGMQGQAGGIGFAYADGSAWADHIKVFQPAGPVILETTDKDIAGSGAPYRDLLEPNSWLEKTAHDLWTLNEGRFSILRRRGVNLPDLEAMHAVAGRAINNKNDDVDDQVSSDRDAEPNAYEQMRSIAISDKLHRPLRAELDDLVRAVSLLLMLAIPFAFALERLMIAAVSIYGRIGWFMVIFLATFTALYFTHAGFSVATTPVLIFLAFAILLLSSLVIILLVRKFQSELHAIHGHNTNTGDAVSQVGVMLAAVGMGLSTMRRRPVVTVLTIATVTVLTFTIITFASLQMGVSVRTTNLGPIDLQMPDEALLVRRLDYGKLESGMLGLMPDAQVLRQSWVVDEAISIAGVDGHRSRQVQGIMGLDPAELQRWPALAAVLGAAMNDNDVFMTRSLADELQVTVGSHVQVRGVNCNVAGFFDSAALTRLRHVDEQPILPVDPTEMTSSSGSNSQDVDTLAVDEVQREFTRLSAAQVVIVNARLVEAMGGEPAMYSVYPNAGQTISEYATSLAERLSTPVWSAEASGLKRRVLTRQTTISGVGVVMPLLLGAMIIFGTLMGSITDRKADVYTFSALGLSPKHVGTLFFAEAMVYAILGCMGGILLALCFGSLVGMLGRAGYMQPLAVNYASTNTILTATMVGVSVLVSAIYPAIRAGRSANPGVARRWVMPMPEGDQLALTFPFTVSSYDMTGVVSYLAEHFHAHRDAGLGAFACSAARVSQDADRRLVLHAELALAPFDLGVTQRMTMTAIPMPEIEGIDEIVLKIDRVSGTRGDWTRANRAFLKHLRRQFLLWRTLNPELIQKYRQQTLETLGSDSDTASKAAMDEPHQQNESSGQDDQAGQDEEVIA